MKSTISTQPDEGLAGLSDTSANLSEGLDPSPSPPEDSPSGQPEYSHSAVYMLRTVQQHHVQLSAMADQKASIMVGACLIVVTICATQIGNGNLHPSLFVWAAFSLAAAAVGVLAVLPRFASRKTSSINPHRNLLFFGNFADLSDEEYGEEMLAIVRHDESVMRAMIRDIHQMGKVLHFKKYRYLAMSYHIFLWGLLASLVTGLSTLIFSTLF